MAGAGNFFFIRSTRLRSAEVVLRDGKPLWETSNATFSGINRLCGDKASGLFAEPTVKNQDGSDVLNVAWFGLHDDDAKDFASLDRAKLARVEEDLVQRLEALRPALNDPEIGAAVAAMLNIYDENSIVAVGEHAVITNWGALPASATASPAAYARHTDATIGRFLKNDIGPSLPGKAWPAHGTIEPGVRAQPVGGMIPPAPVAPVAAVAAAARDTTRRPARWWIPAALAAFFGAILAYVAWPGNLVYEKEALTEPGILSQLETSNQALTQNIAQLRQELGKDACMIDPTLVGLPPREAAAAPTNPAGAPNATKTGKGAVK